MSEQANTLSFSIPDMHCEHCEAKVRVMVESVDGVLSASPDREAGTVTVSLDSESPATEEAIRAQLSAGGYPAA